MLAAFSFAGRDWESAESACRIKGFLLSETGVKNFWLDALDGNHRSWASNRPNKQACMTKQREWRRSFWELPDQLGVGTRG